jgi:hypothetical protein
VLSGQTRFDVMRRACVSEVASRPHRRTGTYAWLHFTTHLPVESSEKGTYSQHDGKHAPAAVAPIHHPRQIKLDTIVKQRYQRASTSTSYSSSLSQILCIDLISLIIFNLGKLVRAMFLLPSTATALLGVLLSLSPGDNGFVGASSRAVNDQRLEDPTNTESARNLRSSPGESRLLQQATAIGVNFVNIKSSAGVGATEAQVRAQIDVLNTAFRPDFVFNLNATREVTNDNYFGNINTDILPNPVEMQMKQEYRRGGMETLNVYSVQLVRDGRTTVGYATLPVADGGPSDGIVIDYTTVPNDRGGETDMGMVSVTNKRSSASDTSVLTVPFVSLRPDTRSRGGALAKP